jgi:hypothetical protein
MDEKCFVKDCPNFGIFPFTKYVNGVARETRFLCKDHFTEAFHDGKISIEFVSTDVDGD